MSILGLNWSPVHNTVLQCAITGGALVLGPCATACKKLTWKGALLRLLPSSFDPATGLAAAGVVIVLGIIFTTKTNLIDMFIDVNRKDSNGKLLRDPNGKTYNIMTHI
jgi:hypothetical protein